MIWLLAVLVILVVGGLVILAVARGAAMAPAADDRREVRLPADRPLRAEDLRTTRFTMALRGYRMPEVDALLARLAAEMEERTSATTDRSVDVTAPLSGQEDTGAR